VALVNKALVWA